MKEFWCLRPWNGAVSLLWFVGLTLEVLEAPTAAQKPGKRSNETSSCAAVRVAWGAKGLGPHAVPTSMISGDHLRLCPQGRTCCTGSMEEKLKSLGRQDFVKMSIGALSSIRHDFIIRSTKFEAFCVELVENSTKELHEMFQKTYGLIYLQNSQIFADLFRDLRNFFRERNLDLHDVLEKFFSVLFQRMFALLNTSYDFDPQYLSCVAENMEELKPFGDVPQKLSVHIRRAFIAARTFLQGLQVGRNVISRIAKVEASESCSQAVTRMLYCPYCRGLIALKPCLDYCTNVMRACFHYDVELGDVWNAYVEAMLKVADRLEGPFNIESVIEPLDVKISDAIMNFQENSEAVTSKGRNLSISQSSSLSQPYRSTCSDPSSVTNSGKVFQQCGQPTLGSRRKRRQSSAGQPMPRAGGQPQKNGVLRPSVQPVTALDRTMPDIREVLASSKDFWRQLALTTCGVVSAPLSHENNCWNGKSKARYMLEIVEEGVENVSKNPEVTVDLPRSSAVVEQQVLQLKLIIGKLQNAYAGQDVNWMETDGEDDDEDENSGDLAESSTSPLPPHHHHHRHHLKEDNDDTSVTVSTFRPVDVYSTKRVANSERSGVQVRMKSQQNVSTNIRPFLHFWILIAFLSGIQFILLHS